MLLSSYNFRGKVGIISLAAIIILLLADRFTEFMIQGYEPAVVAGIISIVAGVFLLLIDYMAEGRKPLSYPLLTWAGRLLMLAVLLLGFPLVFPNLKSFFDFLPYEFDLTATAVYSAMFLITLLAFKMPTAGKPRM